MAGTLSDRQFLTWEGLQLLSQLSKQQFDQAISDLKNEINDKIVESDTYFNFPTVGNTNTIYIDTTANKSYRWDNQNLKYYVIGSDYEDIKVINGCIE